MAIKFVVPPEDQWSRRDTSNTGFRARPYNHVERITEQRKFADDLRENPGKWAIYPGNLNSERSQYSTAGNIRRGLTKAFQPRGAFEARSRRKDGEIKIYVSYKGENQ